jgi:hypothetical protein
VPIIAWGKYQKELADEATLRDWFGAAPTNLAIVTGGLSGLVVVDADSPEALQWCTRRLKYTPWQVKTSRGFHLYYGHPGVPVGNRARLETPDGRLAIDVRGDGGYVIGPGSLHASGAVYESAGDWTANRDALPRFWPGWLQRPRRSTATVQPTAAREAVSAGDLVSRARRYLAAIPVPDIGAGSDTAMLYAACRLVRGFDLAASDAETLLWDWAGGRPGWTREWIATKVQHAEKYGNEPIGALR